MPVALLWTVFCPARENGNRTVITRSERRLTFMEVDAAGQAWNISPRSRQPGREAMERDFRWAMRLPAPVPVLLAPGAKNGVTAGVRRYPGSKGGEGVWQRIISEMPPHTVFIEAFCGTAIITKNKRPALVNVAIDIDPEAITRAKANLSRDDKNGVADRQAPTSTAFRSECAIGFLSSYEWTGGELVYCDPPYLKEARSCPRRYYRFEMMAIEQHARLLAVLKSLPCMVILSGYRSKLYDRELADWRTVDIPTVNSRGKRVTETLWLNFREPARLHDYRFLGRDHRERQRIKKKLRRWVARLARLPALERAALVAAVAQLETPKMTFPDPHAGNGAGRGVLFAEEKPNGQSSDRQNHKRQAAAPLPLSLGRRRQK